MVAQSIKVGFAVRQLIPTKVVYCIMKSALYLNRKKVMGKQKTQLFIDLLFALAYWYKADKGNWKPLYAKVNLESMLHG